MHVRDF